MAHEFKPRMIVAEASSYARLIDYEKLSQIARDIGAYFMVDMAHIAGLVAGGAIPSPVRHSDFVTFTCYKTMMGARGGVILSRGKYAKQINASVFPGCQDTSPVNVMAAKALTFKLAMGPGFKAIQQNTIENAKHLAAALSRHGYRIVSGGTDNHQVIIDVGSKGLEGGATEKALEAVGIVANRNVIPRDSDRQGAVSGVRLGTCSLSARGMGKLQMGVIADLMDKTMSNPGAPGTFERVSREVQALCREYPVPF